MKSFKDPGFADRVALAAAAKQKALDQLRAKPPVDEAVLAERRAAREAKDAAEAEKRAAKKAAQEAARAAKEEAAAAAAAAAPKSKELTEAERKAIRDERYAARKKRK